MASKTDQTGREKIKITVVGRCTHPVQRVQYGNTLRWLCSECGYVEKHHVEQRMVKAVRK